MGPSLKLTLIPPKQPYISEKQKVVVKRDASIDNLIKLRNDFRSPNIKTPRNQIQNGILKNTSSSRFNSFNEPNLIKSPGRECKRRVNFIEKNLV